MDKEKPDQEELAEACQAAWDGFHREIGDYPWLLDGLEEEE